MNQRTDKDLRDLILRRIYEKRDAINVEFTQYLEGIETRVFFRICRQLEGQGYIKIQNEVLGEGAAGGFETCEATFIITAAGSDHVEALISKEALNASMVNLLRGDVISG